MYKVLSVKSNPNTTSVVIQGLANPIEYCTRLLPEGIKAGCYLTQEELEYKGIAPATITRLDFHKNDVTVFIDAGHHPLTFDKREWLSEPQYNTLSVGDDLPGILVDMNFVKRQWGL